MSNGGSTHDTLTLGAGPGGAAGSITTLTMAVALRFGGATFLRGLFAAARVIPQIPAPIYRLAFIHYLRWTIVDELPDGKGGKQKLSPPCMLFEGDFDGNIFQYIDTFVHALPWRERAVWGMGRGYPGLHPVNRFVDWIHAQTVPVDHEWHAYPEATTRMVGSGIKIKDALAEFDRIAARTAGDEARFAEEFALLLERVQKDI